MTRSLSSRKQSKIFSKTVSEFARITLPVAYLERQLARAIQLNPAINDELLSQPPVAADTIDGGNVDDHASILANMIQGSTLIKSYEQMMQQYERDHERKSKIID